VAVPPILVARGLGKSFGGRRVVESFDLVLSRNEVVGLLGPNGSGKSTILRMIAGYLQPTTGQVEVAGFDVVRQGLEARSRIGYVPEDVPLYTTMRTREFLSFMGRVRGLTRPELGPAVDVVIERLSLQHVQSRMIGKLSRGFRQRVAIAQALLGRPALLLLDEPTNGLDPRQIIELRETVRLLSGEVAILVSSHVLAEIERVADRAAILLDGRLLDVLPLDGVAPGGLEEMFLQLTAEEAGTHPVGALT
jgi:ABC-2 type transport system ATP-binding protein